MAAAEKRPIIPIKDLVELNKRGFPIDNISVQFKDYAWLAQFFERCFQDLHSRKIILPALEKKNIRGLEHLSIYIYKRLGFGTRELLNLYLRRKTGVSLKVIIFLVTECGQKFEEIQEQISFMYTPHSNFGMSIIYVLHNSGKALSPFDIAAGVENIFGTKINRHKASVATWDMTRKAGYLVNFGKKGEPLYTLRGEEFKYKK